MHSAQTIRITKVDSSRETMSKKSDLLERFSWKLPACQAFVTLDVFLAGFCRDIFGQNHAGTGFIEVDTFEIVADELLVETLLVPAGFVFIGGPEP